MSLDDSNTWDDVLIEIDYEDVRIHGIRELIGQDFQIRANALEAARYAALYLNRPQIPAPRLRLVDSVEYVWKFDDAIHNEIRIAFNGYFEAPLSGSGYYGHQVAVEPGDIKFSVKQFETIEFNDFADAHAKVAEWVNDLVRKHNVNG